MNLGDNPMCGYIQDQIFWNRLAHGWGGRAGHPLIKMSVVWPLAPAACQSVLAQDTNPKLLLLAIPSLCECIMAELRNIVGCLGKRSAVLLLMSGSTPCISASAISVWMCMWISEWVECFKGSPWTYRENIVEQQLWVRDLDQKEVTLVNVYIQPDRDTVREF